MVTKILNIIEKEFVPEDEYSGPQINDSSLFSIKETYKEVGPIFFFSIEANLDVDIFISIKGKSIQILGINEIFGGFSNKDDSACVKIIKDILPEEGYSFALSENNTLIVFPENYV